MGEGIIVKAGNYYIRRFDDKSVWIEKSDGEGAGEGMQVSDEKFTRWMDKIWKEHF